MALITSAPSFPYVWVSSPPPPGNRQTRRLFGVPLFFPRDTLIKSSLGILIGLADLQSVADAGEGRTPSPSETPIFFLAERWTYDF